MVSGSVHDCDGELLGGGKAGDRRSLGEIAGVRSEESKLGGREGRENASGRAGGRQGVGEIEVLWEEFFLKGGSDRVEFGFLKETRMWVNGDKLR